MTSGHSVIVAPPIGVIAEDDTDCDVVAVLVRRILPTPARIRVMRRRGNGCAPLRRKAGAWMKDLAASGCTSVVLLHDCDTNDEAALRRVLGRIDAPSSVERLICIPVEELEAWFWSDPAVVAHVGRGKGKALPEPHRLKDPKGELIRLSRDEGRKPLYSVNDNKDLSELLDMDLCERRCPAFRDLRQFVTQHWRSATAAAQGRAKAKRSRPRRRRRQGRR